jgi:hypothetical protein
MATTAAGTPYVEASDLVAGYPAVSLALADHIDGLDGGKVLQVVSTTKTDTFATTSGSYTDVTGMSVSITPTATDSKILIHLSAQVGGSFHGTAQYHGRLLRDSTAIAIGAAAGSRTLASFSTASIQAYTMSTSSLVFLDAPATVSAVTYKIQVLSTSASGTFQLNRTETDTDAALYSRTASTITVMEIGA